MRRGVGRRAGVRVCGGFTLVELLAVIGIIAALMGLATLSMQGLSERDRAAEAVEQVRGALELARQTAVATGTHCYVAMGDDGGGTLLVQAVRSLEGEVVSGSHDLVNQSDPPGFDFLGNLARSGEVDVVDAIADTSKFLSLPDSAYLDAATTTGPDGNTISFTVNDPNRTDDPTLDRVVAFSPRGAALVPGKSGVQAIKLFVVPSAGDAPSANEEARAALVWIHAATGQVEVYR